MPSGNGKTTGGKSTGARGPTGARGEVRSSPAGDKGGKAGSVSRNPGAMRGSSQTTKTGYRGPTGPAQQPRSSPAGNKNGAPGAVSRAKTTTGPRGPTGPQGQRRAAPQSGYTGVGKRFGKPANEVIDLRKMQGPPTPPTPRDVADAGWRKYRDLERAYQNEAISTIAGNMAPTGAQYGMKRAQIRDAFTDMNAREARNYALKNSNLDRSSMPMRDTVSRDISRSLPTTALPSRAGVFDKMKGAYKAARKSIGDALYGPEEEGSLRAKINSSYRKGGAVKTRGNALKTREKK